MKTPAFKFTVTDNTTGRVTDSTYCTTLHAAAIMDEHYTASVPHNSRYSIESGLVWPPVPYNHETTLAALENEFYAGATLRTISTALCMLAFALFTLWVFSTAYQLGVL